MQLRLRIFNFLNPDLENPTARKIDFFISVLIILSIVSIIVESMMEMDYKGNLLEWTRRTHYYQSVLQYLNIFEWITLCIFFVEYVLRLMTADYLFTKEKNRFGAIKKFMFSWSGIIDLLSILPLFFQFLQIDLRFLRALKFTRLLRLFKMKQLVHSTRLVSEVFVEKKEELGVTMFVAFILLLVSSTLMWYVEGEVQPEVFSNILSSFWWAIATLTTVGYGDVYPITAWGKFLSGLIAVLGIGIVALPAGILSSAFIEKLEEKRRKSDASETKNINCLSQFGKAYLYCPYCGKKMDDNGNHITTEST